MGTKEKNKHLSDKQQLLESLLKRMGWSIRDFAKNYCEFMSEYHMATDRGEEAIRKAFARGSISDERVNAYLDFLYRQEGFRRLDIIIPRHTPIEGEDDTDGMRTISRMISRELKKRDMDSDE